MAGPILQMNERERKLVSVLAAVGAVLLVCAVPFGLDLFLRTERAENEDMRQALADVQDARTRVRDRQQKKDAILARYARKAPELAGYLEQTARQQKLEVTESTPMPDVPHGKRYAEHVTSIHLKKAGLLPISKFLESIERSGFPLAITRLNVRKRTGEPDSYDVEVSVSAYDRTEPAAPEPAGSAKP